MSPTQACVFSLVSLNDIVQLIEEVSRQDGWKTHEDSDYGINV